MDQATDRSIDSSLVEAMLRLAEKDRRFGELATAWEETHVNLTGPGDSLKAYLLMALQQKLENRPLAIFVPDELAARSFQMNLQAFSDDPEAIRVFRARELELASAEAVSRDMEQQRLGVLKALGEGTVQVLIVSGAAALQLLPSPRDLNEISIKLKLGQRFDLEELTRHLSDLGYERMQLAEIPGQFARRGDILDIVPIGLPENHRNIGTGIGWRISFFDDEIDQIKRFAIESQRSIENLTTCVVPPALEVMIRPEDRDNVAAAVKAYGEARIHDLRKTPSLAETAGRLTDLLEEDVAKLAAGEAFPGIDKWLGLIWPEGATILDYLLEAGFLIAVDEPLRLRNRLDASQAEMAERVTSHLSKGQSFDLATESQIKGAELFRALDQRTEVLSLATIPSSGNGFPKALNITIPGREAESYRGHEARLLPLIEARNDKSEATYFLTGADQRSERLRSYFAEEGLADKPSILDRALDRGFEYPAAGLMVFGSHDIFGQERRRSRRKSRLKGVKIDLFSDLKPGERVVHEAYGIGIYEGLTTNLDASGTKRDFLSISYAGDDKLHLPMEQLDQIQKYVGSEGKMPKLTRLGTQEWSRLKERARASIRELATDLVSLYARRSAIKGHRFPPDNSWDQDFAASFPYMETEDQLRCIEEVRSDMESDKVMDRLLCGDVGFGKTEVAFRAMFKAVGDSKQALLLAPTTVLAQQHYQNFVERIGEFPVRVGLLSRFASPKEINKTIRGLANGSIDVAIGTHRLLSKDVKCKNLGLLVVDEEQRFGVDHKEKIKAMKPDVDVLTLTATPIPRTLHMSMSGIRDISVIEEPPEDRRPVQTYVMEYDEAIIQDALLREISREGQVFYLYNDTRKIREKAAALAEAMPGVRVSFAHGKMNVHELEDIISDFVLGNADILVCTTIIESGIDMPNVNTIIVENADRLGLAQLYQLRGRVGRSSRQAYAYVTYMKNKVLTEISEKRLAAIRDYTELGAGFKIALRDLEVRGAGNLLGAEQHGQLETIGYDLYTRMLEDEINRAKLEMTKEGLMADPAIASAVQQAGQVSATMRGQDQIDITTVRKVAFPGAAGSAPSPQIPHITPVDCVVELALDSYIPRDFIPDDGERMDLYRRISHISNSADYQDVIDEISDRFGDLPAAVLTLCDISYIRAKAGSMGITRVFVQKTSVIFLLATESKPDMEQIFAMLSLPQYQRNLHFNAGSKPYLQYLGAAVSLQAIPSKLRKLFLDMQAVIDQQSSAS